MKVLGGFLKFLSILMMLIGAAICAICCFQAVTIEEPALYFVGGLIFLCVLIVALCVLGIGAALSQIVKLKKQVVQLEQWIRNAFIAGSITPTSSNDAAQPTDEAQIPMEMPIRASVPAAKSKNTLLPVVITSATVITVLLVVLIVVVIGGKTQNVQLQGPAELPGTITTLPPIEMETPENENPPVQIEAETLTMGSALETDFVKILFTDVVVERDIQNSVTIDRVTRITGPDPVPGQKYICLSGTIINTSTAPLPVYDFFLGKFTLDSYTYEVTANDCDILSAYGDTESMIEHLMEYEIRIYKAIPDALADTFSTCSFNFGFYDGFDNHELSYNKSFSDNPIAECPYQYFIPLT